MSRFSKCSRPCVTSDKGLKCSQFTPCVTRDWTLDRNSTVCGLRTCYDAFLKFSLTSWKLSHILLPLNCSFMSYVHYWGTIWGHIQCACRGSSKKGYNVKRFVRVSSGMPPALSPLISLGSLSSLTRISPDYEWWAEESSCVNEINALRSYLSLNLTYIHLYFISLFPSINYLYQTGMGGNIIRQR